MQNGAASQKTCFEAGSSSSLHNKNTSDRTANGSALTAFLILLLIAIFFRGGGKIQSVKPVLEPSEAVNVG
jgi:hypothetical protein